MKFFILASVALALNGSVEGNTAIPAIPDTGTPAGDKLCSKLRLVLKAANEKPSFSSLKGELFEKEGAGVTAYKSSTFLLSADEQCKVRENAIYQERWTATFSCSLASGLADSSSVREMGERFARFTGSCLGPGWEHEHDSTLDQIYSSEADLYMSQKAKTGILIVRVAGIKDHKTDITVIFTRYR